MEYTYRSMSISPKIEIKSRSKDHTSSNADRVKEPNVLQHFEYSVMRAVEDLGESAFPAEITRRLMKELNRNVSLAQVFMTLQRLKDKGCVTHRDSLPKSERGGRRRKIFKVEAPGCQALDLTATIYNQAPDPQRGRRSSEQLQPEPTGKPAVA